MEFELQATVALLERTPLALDGLLRGLGASWTEANEGGVSWNVRGVVAHLLEGERHDWMPRVRLILEFGEGQPFAPFDREGFLRAAEGRPVEELLDEFAAARRTGLAELRGLGLQAEDFERTGRHPAFGRVTLGQLLATWAVHDLTHLHQVSRILAGQYAKAVGPWEKFLGVLHCEGHGG